MCCLGETSATAHSATTARSVCSRRGGRVHKTARACCPAPPSKQQHLYSGHSSCRWCACCGSRGCCSLLACMNCTPLRLISSLSSLCSSCHSTSSSLSICAPSQEYGTEESSSRGGGGGGAEAGETQLLARGTIATQPRATAEPAGGPAGQPTSRRVRRQRAAWKLTSEKSIAGKLGMISRIGRRLSQGCSPRCSLQRAQESQAEHTRLTLRPEKRANPGAGIAHLNVAYHCPTALEPRPMQALQLCRPLTCSPPRR